jgi:uncharacterized protein (DUF1501 family)
MPLNRRTFLQASTAAAALMPRLVFADADTDARFVLVILRGALDGLAAVPAYGDSDYARTRGELGVAALDHKLDGTFALHPALTHMYERYRAKELIAFHAVATPYRERSHFDGQDLLENGTADPKGSRDGWLNRVLPVLPISQERATERIALAVAQNVPLVLRGDARVNSWAPSRLPETDSDTLQRIADLYSSDPYFATRLQSALAADEGAGAMSGEGASKRRDPLYALAPTAEAAGKFMAADDGPRIAVIETGGWDTHANQGAERGQLATRLRGLDQGLQAFKTAIGAAWARSAVLVVTEFGRTVAVNGTRGTDHGTATCAFLLGGAINGGRVIADWPGLASSALHQGRDLKPTLDMRSVLKGVLASHLGVTERDLEERVFPNSRIAKPLEGLTRDPAQRVS